MKELRCLALLLVTIPFLLVPASVVAQEKVTCYTTWDANYFYASFQVDDPNVTGTNTKPGSDPWEDDSVEIFLETDNRHQTGRSKNTYSMAVSAAGGSAFTLGSDSGSPQKKAIFSFKYSSSVDGSPNDPDDLDVGYIVEIALPWRELGVEPPTPGVMMSFHAVVRMRGDTNRFVSLSPKVKTEEDIQDASKWVDIVFTGPMFGAATFSIEKIVSARYIARMPLIDGQIKQSEYNKNTSFVMPLPFEAPKGPRHQFQRMVLTYYFYWYQGDPRKAGRFEHVRGADGRSELTDQPIRAPGPWFSYDRVQWHKEELSDVRRAGIDIVLPIYWGDPGNRSGFAAKGLDCMVEALRELKAENRPYPMVGMFFDTTAMSLAYGAKPDLRDEEVKRTFYGMIRDFFMRVPEEFRAHVQMDDERGSRPCYIVDLYTAGWFSDLDASFVDYVNKRFAEDFDAGICWLAGKDFKDRVPGLDGYCSYGAGLGFGFDDSAKIRIAAVGAGFDDTAVPGRTTPIRARDDGNVYKNDWAAALDTRPHWIMVDGWNELHEGSEICASRQYGSRFVEATALQSLRFRGPRQYDAKYLRHSVPRVILPGRFYQVDLLIQNDGNEPWLASRGYALSYRWYQGSRLIGESGIKRPIQRDILPGRSGEVTIGVAAVKKDGGALPDGDYQIRFELVRMADDKWFSSLGSPGFSVPVRVGQPQELQPRYLTVSGPVMMKTGAPYRLRVRVRNDGSLIWKAPVTALGCRLFKVSSYIHGALGEMREEVPIVPIRAKLVKDVQPGQIAEAELLVVLKEPRGQAVPAWKQSDPWSYQLRLDIWDGSRWLSDAGARSCDRIIDLFDADYGAAFIDANVPQTLNAGTTCDVKLVVRNTGVDAWDPKRHGFGCHWYYLDGIEAVWDGERTPIKAATRPGDPSVEVVKVTAPAFDGRYVLAIDFADRDRWASTSEITRGGDLFIREVTVTGGKLVFADLSTVFNAGAASPDTDRKSGDFDGSGLSFPAEFMPPDAGLGGPNDLYPSGYLWTAQGAGLQSWRRISFRYGSDAYGAKNAVICQGQAAPVPEGSYARVHILGAAISGEQEAEFGLRYAESEQTAKVAMSSWTGEPGHGEEVGYVALHRHSPSGDERGTRCWLFHYVISIEPSRPLKEIVLPKNDKVRVAAITLERP